MKKTRNQKTNPKQTNDIFLCWYYMCSIKKPTNNNPDMSKDSQKTFLLHSKIRSTEGGQFRNGLNLLPF